MDTVSKIVGFIGMLIVIAIASGIGKEVVSPSADLDRHQKQTPGHPVRQEQAGKTSRGESPLLGKV